MTEYYVTEKRQETPSRSAHEALKNYYDLKMKADLYFKRLSDETEVLFSHFVKYAREENAKRSRNFSELVESFYYEILNMECNENDKVVRASLTKKFKRLMKKHITNDSKNQIKLDDYLA
jgi:hypothetical protein